MMMRDTIARKIRNHRDREVLQRALEGASTPSMRDELIVLAQRQLG